MIFRINIDKSKVRLIKSYVYALPVSESRKYYSLLNAISNNFYGSCKSLTASEFALYQSILKSKKVKK